MRAIVLSSLLVVSAAGARWSGGWAVISVDDMPTHVVAGDTVNLSFMVRQHGVHPMPDLSPVVTVRIGGEDVVIPARNGGRTGHYRSAFLVRKTGNAHVTIDTRFMRAAVDLVPIPVVAASVRATAPPARDLGHRLFVAKGCVSCHTHSEVTPTNHVGGAVDLTERRYTAAYLRKLLEDPAAVVKTGSTFSMPDLELKAHEITALTAFINADR